MAGPIRIVLVGLGKIARDQHLPALALDSRFEVAGVVDPVAGLEGLPHAESLERILAQDIVFDAVALCTPPQVRAGLALRALEAGKHVLLEKPPGVTATEIEALIPVAAAKGLTLMTAWHARYAAAVEPARRALAGQRLLGGRITWKEDVRVWHPGQQWLWQPGGMGVFDPGINALSILTSLVDTTWSVRRARLEQPANQFMPVSAQLELTSAEGAEIDVDFDFLHPGPPIWEIALETDGGPLTLADGGATLRTAGPPVPLQLDREYAAVYDHFARLIAEGTGFTDLAPLRLVEEAMRVAVTAPTAAIAV
jgi:D-galactose 1-dehydrogenase